MKNRPVSVLGITSVLALVGLLPSAAQAAHRHALLIGISDYGHFHADTPETGRLFKDLDCAEDVKQIGAALEHTFRFDPKTGEIVTLTTPEQTTRTAILDALQHLVDAARQDGPGDVIYIHYSGHGDEVLDPTEPTGLDSAIVPADYKTPPPGAKTEATSNEISGKTIRSCIRQLQAQHPAQIALSFDCCHSASVARGAVTPSAKSRGINASEYADWYRQSAAPKVRGGAAAHGPQALMRGPGAPQAQDDLTGDGYVVISACRNTDCAFETDGTPTMGRLSACLAHVLMMATPQTTYRQVYDQVYARFHERYPDQHPQLDGSDPDTPLLGGQAVAAPPALLVLVDAPGHYTLDAGSLLGMSVGSEFAVYARDDTQHKPGTQIADARITSVSATTSTLQVTMKKAGLTSEDLSAARAVETAHDYAVPPLALDADSLRRALPARADAILTQIEDLKMVSTMPPAAGRDYDVAAARVGQGIALVRVSSGTTLVSLDPSATDLSAQVYTTLQKEARYRYACGLGEDQGGLNHDSQIQIRLVPTDADGNTLPTAAPRSPADARLVLPLKSHFVIQVQNKSDRPLHLAVLDLESSGDISQVWPAAGSTAHDNIITPTPGDDWTTLWVSADADTTQKAVYQATSADADEMYKAIATRAAARQGDPHDEYVDFAPLTTRGGSRGPESPFSDLFGPAVDEGRHRTALSTQIDPGSWTATTFPFEVK